jgi:transglutaminase-like putative cysteine protease
MRDVVRKGIKEPTIVPIARLLVQDVPEKNQRAEADMLFYFAKDAIRYVRDPLDIEGVVYPRQVLEMQAGDCDDKVVLFATLANAIGIPARFVAIKLPGKDFYSHVYAELQVNGVWVPYELTVQAATPGRSFAPAGSQKMILEVNPEPTSIKGFFRNILSGGGGMAYLAGPVGSYVSKDTALSAYPDMPSWYQGTTSWFDTWSKKLQQIANILRETPNIPEYAKTGQEVSTSKENFEYWVKQPFTWVLGGALVLAIYKVRKARTP